MYEWFGDKHYEGDWKDGKMHGRGRLVYENGDVYDGNFHKGKKFGKGIFKWAKDGNYYDGEWNNNLPHGIGYIGREGVSKRKAMFEDGRNVAWIDLD